MSIESQLAMISGGRTMLLSLPGGRSIELPAEEIKAALGFAEHITKSANKLRARPIPEQQIGIHIVLWKYCGDSISQHILEKAIARLAFYHWWKYAPGDEDMISRGMMKRLAKLLLLDMVNPHAVRLKGPTNMAKMVNVDPKTWQRKLTRHYSVITQECQHRESGIIENLRMVYSRKEGLGELLAAREKTE